MFREPLPIVDQRRVERLRFARAPTTDHPRVPFDRRRPFGPMHRAHQRRAQRLPVVIARPTVRRRHHQRQSKSRHGVVPGHQLQQPLERFLVESVAGLACADRRHTGRNHPLVFGHLGSQIVGARRLERHFQSLVKRHGVEQLHERTLEGRALSRFDLLDPFGLAIDLLVGGAQLGEGVVFPALGQLEQAQQLDVVDPENGALIGALRLHHHLQQPFDGAQGAARAVFLQRHGLFGADLQQRVAGDRVEGLKPPVHQHGQLRELRHVELRSRPGPERHHHPERHRRRHQRRNPSFHTASLRFKKGIRCVRN